MKYLKPRCSYVALLDSDGSFLHSFTSYDCAAADIIPLESDEFVFPSMTMRRFVRDSLKLLHKHISKQEWSLKYGESEDNGAYIDGVRYTPKSAIKSVMTRVYLTPEGRKLLQKNAGRIGANVIKKKELYALSPFLQEVEPVDVEKIGHEIKKSRLINKILYGLASWIIIKA